MRCILVSALLGLLAAPVSAGGAGSVAISKDSAGSAANPIRRVVNMLESLAKKVTAEGEKEKELYDKFMCYCTSSGGDVASNIASMGDKVPSLQTDIEEAEGQLAQLKVDLKSHQTDRSAAKAAMEAATAQREKELKEFTASSTELQSFIDALTGAIAALEKGMSGGSALLQAGLGAGLRRAVAADSSVTDYDKSLVTSFLSGEASEQVGYVPKGGEITGILKQMKDDFAESLKGVKETEAKGVKVFEELMAAKTKQVEVLGNEIEKKSARIGDLQLSIVKMQNDMTETEAALVEAKKFAADLEQNCKTKTAEWEERQKTRADELIAIHETIKILNDDDALELFKKTLPSASFLQVRANGAAVRRKALALVQGVLAHASSGMRPQLDFLALALSGRAVDFTKVIKMIDDMVALLKQEQLDDDHKKEYCEAQLDMAEDKTKELGKKIEDLEVSIADRKETIATLTKEIEELMAGVSTLDKRVEEATVQRKKEHEEYQELMTSHAAAKELLAFAKNRLNKFYNPKLYKAPPKRELSEEEQIYSNMGGELEQPAALVQVARHSARRYEPAEPAPAEPFSGGYQKKGAETTGVVSMIDLLIKDLDKEMTEADVEEKEGQKDYEEIMSDSAKKRAADLKSITAKTGEKAMQEESVVAEQSSSDSEKKELMATVQYLGQLHADCDWLLQNFDLRQKARAEEADALKQAKAILSGADFSLAQQAPRSLRGSA